jgi:hypothetical protein
LLVVKRANLVTPQGNRTDELVFLQQWDGNLGPAAAKINGRDNGRITSLNIRLLRCEIGCVNQ